MPNQPSTFDVYIMLCDANEVPEQSGLTRGECIAQLAENSEAYEVNRVLRVTSDTYPFNIRAFDVSEDIFDAAFEALAGVFDGRRIPTSGDLYKGKLGEMIDDFNQAHPDTAREQKIDNDIKARKGG